ncbi:MAG TPA: glycosyltransferase [Chloroflexota bacterium]|nr:glycosyltransferase [Chloroflexota bacterium]
MPASPPLIVYCHLRWDFVWQRPQQLMSRFARDRKVYFVEEPIHPEGAGEPPDGARFERRESEGVTVLQPVCRDLGPGPATAGKLDEMYARLSRDLVDQDELRDYTAWFYTPMLFPAIKGLEPSLVVYDAMDELSLFKGAPPELLPRERELLGRADVVFTGGVSLGKAKAQHHANVHAFPSGVDAAHYAQALQPETKVPDDLEALAAPRVGFFGVIDERTDLELLRRAAELRPSYQLVMLGPVVKIDSAELPRLPNLHYLGQKQYRDLPGYVKGFDVCMMPFALNDATKFISPTKTLEYMAAHKPIVSTPVADVVGSYADAVAICGTAEEFVGAIDAALKETGEERERRVVREREILERNSWDSIAERMDEKMRETRR